IIQELAPKATYRKFQLRLDGKLLTPEAELKEMQKHYEQACQDHPQDPSGGYVGTRLHMSSQLTLTIDGAQVCLDMSTAFDVMPRDGLRAALREAGIEGSPAEILLSWIENSTYRIRIGLLSTDVRSARGVKQGCPVSPLLFAAFSTMVTRRLDAKLGAKWSQKHLTLYADDRHISSLFHSYPAFDKFTQCLGVVLSTLKQHGMIVNADKAAVILTMQGAQRKKAIAEFTRIQKDQRHLKVRSSGQDVFLPVVSQTVYLGAVISYRNFQASTLEHRLTKCKATQSRLHKILQGRDPQDAFTQGPTHPWMKQLLEVPEHEASLLAEAVAPQVGADPQPQAIAIDSEVWEAHVIHQTSATRPHPVTSSGAWSL
ncbi:Capn15, partial [Symbiodinium necroappetens]